MSGKAVEMGMKMATITIQVDDVLIEAARLIAEAMQQRGLSEHALEPQHVLGTAINLGLDPLLQVWCPGVDYFQSTPLPEPPK
jgi:hypothetical protein